MIGAARDVLIRNRMTSRSSVFFAFLAVLAGASCGGPYTSADAAIDVANADAARCPATHGGPATLAVTVDGTAASFCSAESASPANGSSREVRIVGHLPEPPNSADAGGAFGIVLRLDPARIAGSIGQPLSIRGDTTFHLPPDAGFYSYSWGGWDYAADAGASPAVIAASLTFGCFCSQYGDQHQHVEGTVTITAIDGTRVAGHVHLDVSGNIPMWNSGFPHDHVGTADADFDAQISN